MSEQALTHKWEEQGLGAAPFKVVCIITVPSAGLAEHNPTAYNNALQCASEQARGFGVHLCTCDSCGMSLMNNVVIRDAQGKHFVVGLDCARKTNDTKVITVAEKLERARLREARAVKREEARVARNKAHEAKLQAQRDANGGLTDYELQQQQKQAEEAARAVVFAEKNMWLLEVLLHVNGDFAEAMRRELERKDIKDLSPRCIEVLCDIYSKQTGGRRGSKKYDAQVEVFNDKLQTTKGGE